jgi:hypothetical protein
VQSFADDRGCIANRLHNTAIAAHVRTDDGSSEISEPDLEILSVRLEIRLYLQNPYEQAYPEGYAHL